MRETTGRSDPILSVCYKAAMSSEHALEARRKIREDAAAIGVDEAFISKLVDEFYSRVRVHPQLGPVFNNAVDDWPDHLAKLKQFWESVALNAGVYSGRPMQAHLKVKSIELAHFGEIAGPHRALRHAPTDEAVEYFMIRANRIGESLKLGLFFRP